VLLISREYPPFVGGGIGTYTVRMARALVSRARDTGGCEPVVVTVGDTDEPTVELEDGVRVVRLPFLDYVDSQPDWSAPRASILASPRGPACHAAFWAFHRESVLAMQLREHLPWLLEEFSPQAIEAPDTGALLWFILNERRMGRGPLAERGADGPPIVVHLHSPTAWIEALQGGPQPGRAMAELRSMERDVLQWADGLVCPSHALAQWVSQWEPSASTRIEVVPYPLGAAPPAAMPSHEQPIGLFVGRMERRKGFDTLARAMDRLGDGAPVVRIAGRDTFDWSAGEHFGQAALRSIEPGVAARFESLGELEPSALAAQRGRCSIALVPSPNDNFPNTCMEAMDAGQVVIAARAGGMAEMIEDGTSGLLFEPDDAEDLARVLMRATGMSDTERDAMGRAACTRIRSFCDDDSVVSQRLAHATGLRPQTPRPAVGRRLAFVAFGSVDAGLQDALTTALRSNESIQALLPWFARHGPDGPEVVPFSTPAADRRELVMEHPGPIAVDADWWQRLESMGVEGNATAVLVALLDLGARVAVLPDSIAGERDPVDADRPGTPAAQRLTEAERAAARAGEARGRAEHALGQTTAHRDALQAQLAELRSSRAYRLAERLSRIRRRLMGDSLQ